MSLASYALVALLIKALLEADDGLPDDLYASEFGSFNSYALCSNTETLPKNILSNRFDHAIPKERVTKKGKDHGYGSVDKPFH